MTKQVLPTTKAKGLNKVIEQYIKKHTIKGFEKSNGITGIILIRFRGEDMTLTTLIGHISLDFAVASLIKTKIAVNQEPNTGDNPFAT